jgi:glycosyltransferase involved in cell wall biosynthesis
VRIALISEHASPIAALGGEDAGGQNAHVAELANALAARGHDVRVYTRRDATDLPDDVAVHNGVTVVHVPAGPPAAIPKDALLPHMGDFSRWLEARWRNGGWTPEVVHAHFWMSGIAALGAAGPLRLPVVQTYHALGTVKRRYQGAADTSPPQRIGFERTIGRAVDQVVAQCHDEIAELVRLGVPRTRITMVPSGVNVARFTPQGPAVARSPRRPRILSVGRLVERKGFDDLIRAMRYVPGAECVIVGGSPAADLDRDPEAARLRSVVERNLLADRVRLVGAVPFDEMPRWYRSADVLAAAPWYEPFGLTPLEAMACGVPVVASAVGGLTDTVVGGYTGDFVPARNAAALGAALRRLVNDPVRRLAYSAAAVDRVRQCYTWERSAIQLESVYAAVARIPRDSEVAA